MHARFCLLLSAYGIFLSLFLGPHMDAILPAKWCMKGRLEVSYRRQRATVLELLYGFMRCIKFLPEGTYCLRSSNPSSSQAGSSSDVSWKWVHDTRKR